MIIALSFLQWISAYVFLCTQVRLGEWSWTLRSYVPGWTKCLLKYPAWAAWKQRFLAIHTLYRACSRWREKGHIASLVYSVGAVRLSILRRVATTSTAVIVCCTFNAR